jgi:hypothetical protein
MANDPFLTDYLEASWWVYFQSQSPPPGFTLFSPPDLAALENQNDGFFAQVYKETATGDLVIAFDGTSDKLPGSEGLTGADAKLALGIPPAAFADALKFVDQVHKDEGSELPNAPIFVTGHSLGGAEAEAVAAQRTYVSGGVTFGAPGLPWSYYYGPGNSADFTNYVDYADPVGNYSNDVNSIYPFAFGGPHFGTVQYIGSRASQQTIEFGGFAAFLGSNIVQKILTNDLFHNHRLNMTYAPDLNLPLPHHHHRRLHLIQSIRPRFLSLRNKSFPTAKQAIQVQGNWS